MLYKIVHKTTYKYVEALSLCHNIGRLVPRNTDKQTCKHFLIDIDPLPDIFDEYEDFFGNKVFYFSIEQEHKMLTVTVTSEIERLATMNLQMDFFGHETWESVMQQLLLIKPEYVDARQYIPETNMTAHNAEIKAYALQSFYSGRPLLLAAKDLMQRIFQDFAFTPGFTTIATPVSEVMQQRKGVCQDFAHLAISCIRSIGLPARYVSGYIETLPAPGQQKMFGVDASHAWFSVFLPRTGWVDFDPTNNQMPTNQYLTVGWGRDYADVAPLKGIILGNGPHQLQVSVDVRRIGSNMHQSQG